MASKLFETADAPAKLRAARAILDESQERFADRLGVSSAWVAMLEKGTQTPSLKLAVQIEELTGISASDWLLDAQRMSA